MESETAVRQMVEEDRGKLEDEDWDWLVGLRFDGEEPDWGVASAEAMAEELLDALDAATTATRRIANARRSSVVSPVANRISQADGSAAKARVRYPRPPSWWNERSRTVMEEYRELQRLVWNQLEIDGPLALAEVAPFLAGARNLEREAGERHILVYPDPASMRGIIVRREMEVRSGWTRAELKTAGLGKTWFGQRTQPLARISRYITSLAERTGCAEEDVAAFLLCDEPLRLPWVTFDYASPGPPEAIAPAIVITVGTPDVPADDVRRAYLFAREPLRLMRSRPKGDAYQRSRNTTWELVAFVEGRRPEMSWNAIYEEWAACHPKASKGYHSTMNSLRSTYYRAPMRRTGVAR